ncbi:TPA: hypothetical protein SMT55_000948 [Proteus mirabilis]|nr:hypothetical protein [Proteus mirabilis]HEK2723356.1 hypothetical protein [Proteus mirabilis]
MPESTSTIKGKLCSASRITGKKLCVLTESGILIEVNQGKTPLPDLIRRYNTGGIVDCVILIKKGTGLY